MDFTLLAILACLFVGLIAAVNFLMRQQARRKQMFVQLAGTLGANEVTPGSAYTGELDGTPYRYSYFAGSKNSPSYFQVAIDSSSSGAFEVTREKPVHRFFKNIGISVEIQTGDRAFDQAFYIQTNVPDFARQVLNDSARRQVLTRLFDLGYTRVIHNGQSLEAKISPFKPEDLQGRTQVERTVSELATLGQGMDRISKAMGPPRDTGWKARQGTIYTLSIASTFLGFGGFFWGNTAYTALDPFALFLTSLRYGIPAYCLFFLLSITWLKGRSSSHVHILANLGIGLVGIPATAFGTMMVLNGYLDTSQATDHRAKVLGKRYTSSRNSKTYYLALESWRPGRREEEFKVGRGIYQQATAQGHALIINTRPGHYEYEWIVDFRLTREQNHSASPNEHEE